jgi:TP901-1 family phage major tail protein
MAIFNGTDLILKVQAAAGAADEFKLMHSQNVSLTYNVDTIDITNKDSSGNRTLLGGTKSFSLSADGLMDFVSTASTTDVDELFTSSRNRTAVTFTFALSTPAGFTYTGSGFITSLEISGGTEDAPTYSVSIEGSGDIVQNAV